MGEEASCTALPRSLLLSALAVLESRGKELTRTGWDHRLVPGEERRERARSFGMPSVKGQCVRDVTGIYSTGAFPSSEIRYAGYFQYTADSRFLACCEPFR